MADVSREAWLGMQIKFNLRKSALTFRTCNRNAVDSN